MQGRQVLRIEFYFLWTSFVSVVKRWGGVATASLQGFFLLPDKGWRAK